MIGRTISHYKILEKLGEGGMGVVYKAQDTKLDRTVALKFLPAHVSVNEETKARFMQEAKAAAALNHANICTIFGVEEDGGQMFIAMEYIEGGTLREKIPFKKLDEAITVAAQIGEALQEAHSKEIVHRDIKADNIMLTAKGQAKVMDFGLAKLKGSLKITRTSSTIGTLGYMAPEQIQGGEVDYRSDIFSFGVLLFEMLTGKLPFRGEHEAAMVYSIVNEEPQDLAALKPDLSPIVVNLVQRCLEKDPEDRYQTMQDIVSELRRSLKKTGRVMRQITDDASPQDSPKPRSTSGILRPRLTATRGRTILYAVAIVVVLSAVILFLWEPWGTSTEINTGMTSRILDVPLTDIGFPALSGDGNWTAFAAKDAAGSWHMYFMNTSGGDPKAITSDSLTWGSSVDVSFDGSKVVFDALLPGKALPDVFIVSSLGGGMRPLAAGAFAPRWQPDGKRVFFCRGLYPDVAVQIGRIEVWSIAIDGSGEHLEFVDSLTTAGPVSLAISPDNGSAAWIRSFPEGANQEIMVRDLRSGEERQVTFDKKVIAQVSWASNGQIIFSSNRSGNTNLWTVSAEGGTPVQITKGFGPDYGVGISADLKKILCYQVQYIGNFWIGDLKSGTTRQITFDDRAKWDPVLSPDGNRMAFDMNDADGSSNAIYISDRDGSNRRRVASSPGRWTSMNGGWSPNGACLAYVDFPFSYPYDSAKTHVIDPDRGSSKFVTNGLPLGWLNSDTLLFYDYAARKSLIASITTQRVTQLFEDSTLALPVQGGKFVVYLTKPFETVPWIVPVDATFRRRGPARQLKVRESGYKWWGGDASRNFLTFRNGNRLVRLWLTTGKEEVFPGSFPEVGKARSISFRAGSDEFIFDVQQSRGKLVMIENPFR